MYRVSTNLTLFFKFFIPVFWIVFFGSFTLAVFAYGAELGSLFGRPSFKWGTLASFSGGVLLLALTLMRLKRVELNEDFVYVTDYFRSYRYPWHNIAAIEESDFMFIRLVRITFKTPGKFGRRIRFMASHRLYAAFWAAHPGLKPERK